MARYSRRSFLGALVAALTGWLGGALPGTPEAAAPPPQTGPELTQAAEEPGTIVLSASGLPAGLRLNSGTGLISGIGQLDGTSVWFHPDSPERHAPGGP